MAIPLCLPANCSSSSGDIHLRMEGSGAFNTSVTFSCDLGYKLSGSPSLSCNRDVTWSDALPCCIHGGGGGGGGLLTIAKCTLNRAWSTCMSDVEMK